MKKTLIALAAVAATGAAFAQSSVTIDGQVDLGIVKTKGASAKLDVANGFNQIRFRGVEDLGGGLKANFTLAQRFSPESGRADGTANNRPTFQGESTVGLSGAFGSVRLGRALTALQAPVNSTDPWSTGQQASTAFLPSGYLTDPVANADGEGIARTDGIFYNGTFGAVSVGLTVGLENSAAGAGVVGVGSAAPASTNTKNLVSAWVQYAAGPLMVGGGYEQNRRDDKVTAILATYDLGVVKLGAGYGVVNPIASTTDQKNWNLMATMPMGAMTLKAGYAQSKVDTTISKKLGLGIDYALSKRTMIYTSYGRDTEKKTYGYDLGIRHSF